MLKKLKIENFHSIDELQELSFEISKKDKLDDSAYLLSEQQGINLVNVIVGANASGKTNVLKALTFLMWFIENGYSKTKDDDSTGVEVFKLNPDKPSILEIEFCRNKELYRYRISLTSQRVVAESLDKKSLKRFSRIFGYDKRDEKSWNLKTPQLKLNPSDEERFRARKNVALLSCLIDTKYLPDMPFFKARFSNVRSTGFYMGSARARFLNLSEQLSKNLKLREVVLEFAKDIDLGVESFVFAEEMLGENEKSSSQRKQQILSFEHLTEKGSFSLEFLQESNGTQNSISLISQISPILEGGGIAIIDEIDAHLHPNVTRKIISLFENEDTNKYQAQLLFSTHQHLLLNDRTKTQIFLAEKSNETLATEIYRLDDVEGVRNDENFFHKYLAGTYGATPNIHWL